MGVEDIPGTGLFRQSKGGGKGFVSTAVIVTLLLTTEMTDPRDISVMPSEVLKEVLQIMLVKSKKTETQ